MRLLFLISLLIFPLISQATTYHAIVVGVSEYPNLPDEFNLVGPKFDALRVNSMLQQQGVDENNIQVLADGVESSPLPTKANILKAFAQMESALEPGDFAYLHFSGHGSQQPVNLEASNSTNNSDSTDGLDEIFLPRDIGVWSNSVGTVKNSLSDNEIDILVTRLRNTGANVWINFDSCHSGTMTRSLTGKEVRSRNVDFEVLKSDSNNRAVKRANGPVQVQSEPIKQTTLAPVKLNDNAGVLISFGAAQSNEEAPEMTLPNGQTEDPQGLFTYVMTSLISQNPSISYRQLAQGMLTSYNSLPWRRATPLFEGGANLDKPIFHRTEEVSPVYAVVSKKGRHLIQGGQLNGLDVGAIVDVFGDISKKEYIAKLEITQADMASSEGRIVEGTIEKKYSYAELSSPAYPDPIKIKWQVTPESTWTKAVTQLIQDNEMLSRTVEWVKTDQPADISLYVGKDMVYFFTLENETLPCQLQEMANTCDNEPLSSDNGKAEKYLSMPLVGNDLEAYEILNNGLSRMVRSLNLKRLSTRLTGRSPIVSEVYLNDEPRTLDQVVKASDGDNLYVSFVNQGRMPIDLTVMFIDSGMGIYQVFPEPGYSGRLMAGEAAEFEGSVSESTTGEEQFIVIAVPTNRQTPQISLSHLQQEPMESSTFYEVNLRDVATRGNASESGIGIESMFAQSLGDSPQTRAFKKKSKPTKKASISVIRLQTE